MASDESRNPYLDWNQSPGGDDITMDQIYRAMKDLNRRRGYRAVVHPKIYEEIVSRLEDLGYTVSPSVFVREHEAIVIKEEDHESR